MLSLVSLETGECRIVSSDDETTSGGALQYWRRDTAGQLRLICAWAPNRWISTRQISAEAAALLIRDGLAIDDRPAKAAESQKASSSTAPRTAEGINSSSRTTTSEPKAVPAQADGRTWKNRYLGKNTLGENLTIKKFPSGDFVIQAQRTGGDQFLADVPKTLDPWTITVTQAAKAIEEKRARRARKAR